jgi:hypothetical protein
MNIEDLDLLILIIVSFIIGFIVSKMYYNNYNNDKEHLVNLDDSRKEALTKCCDNEKCYSKPPYLRKNCIENKNKSLKDLESQFKQMYTQDQYYEKIDKLGVITNKTNFERDRELLNKLNEKLNVNNRLDQLTYDNIRNDIRDEVKGSDKGNYSPYKQSDKLI